MPAYPPLPGDKKVYIALRNKSYQDADTGDILPSAFELRASELRDSKAHDGDGISVIICDDPPKTSDLKNLVPGLRSKVCGVDVLTVADVRALGLDVIQDAEHHGYLQGLPYQCSGMAGDAEKATELAGKLALLSKPVDRQPYNADMSPPSVAGKEVKTPPAAADDLRQASE